jgi:hypothetical protein
MRAISLFFGIACSLSVLNAQITITNSVVPNIGSNVIFDEVISTAVSSINVGPGGPNQVWNFATLPLSNFPDTLYYRALSEAPVQGLFPDAQFISTPELSDTSEFTYYKFTNTELALLGTSTGSDKITFSPPFKTLVFPTTATTTYTSNSTVSGAAMGFNFSGTAKGTAKVDGYGTITTPLGTFPCLRMTRTTAIDLTILFFTVTNRDTSVEFWTAAHPAPVLSVSSSYADFLGDVTFIRSATVLKGQTTGVQAAEDLTIETRMLPNPSSGVSTLETYLPTAGAVTLSIIDLRGSLVRHEHLGYTPPGRLQHAIDLSRQTPGSYLIVVRQDGRVHASTTLVRQ